MSWIDVILGAERPAEGETRRLRGRDIALVSGILRDRGVWDADQVQTEEMFAYKWHRRDSYGSEANDRAQRAWLIERYGDLGARLPDNATVLDAGCGAGYAARLLFEAHLPRLNYVGVDISRAVEIARETLGPLAADSLFYQGDLLQLPFRSGTIDLVISEGVMHHTRSTREAVGALSALVKPGGLLAFYVYAKKAPAREFTDDHIRAIVADMAPDEAWSAMKPLTKLGLALGDLNAEIDVEEEVALLGIPKGKISVQRLFYYYVCKAFYRPDYSLEEMNHINFDWFTPKYCHRQTPEEVRAWCAESGLKIETMTVELSGITVIARKTS